jgi:hypothetical protein
MARATSTTKYLHTACGSATRWGADGLTCLGSECGASGLRVPDCTPVSVPMPRSAPSARPHAVPGDVPLFDVEEIPGLAEREAGE